MLTVWLLCSIFLALVAEVILGNHGLRVPLFALAAFYVTVVHGWRRPLVWLLLLGTCLDLAYGRSFPASLLALPAVLPVAMFWRRHGDCRHAAAQVLAGAAVGLLSALAAVLGLVLPGARWDAALGGEVILMLVEGALAGGLILPLLCLGLDAVAEAMVFDRYQQVRHGR